MLISGECFCGSIKYETSGFLRDARSCHCSRCCKAFSSQASSYALVDHDDFNWVQGAHLLTSYTTQEHCGLQFCSQYGSTLCGTFNGRVHGVTLGCVNSDPDVEIAYHLYVGSKASWKVIPEGVKAYTEGADGRRF